MFGSSPSLEKRRHLLLKNSGNTVIMALVFASVMFLTFYALSTKLIEQKKMMSDLRKNISYSLALKSAIDYAQFGLRNRWCFDDKFLPDDVDRCVGNFSHPKSALRLLMPKSYEADVRSHIATYGSAIFPNVPGAGVALSLQKFEILTDLNGLSTKHPLFKILSTLGVSEAKTLKITFERDDDPTLPRPSQEVYIRITAELLNKFNLTIRNRAEAARQVSRYIVIPREVNYFSLLLPGNMYIGNSSVTLSKGHMGIPALGNLPSGGIVFDSPVFVNGSVFFMSKAYTPVNFNEALVMGNGQLSDALGQPFRPDFISGERKTWRDLNIFGGFEKGFFTDSKRDAGLDVLSGQTPGLAVNNEAIKKCIGFIRGESDLLLTSSSVYKGRSLSAVNGTYLWRTAFSIDPLSSVQNMFTPQNLVAYQLPSKEEQWIKYSFSKAYNSSQQNLIAWVTVSWKENKLKLPLFEEENEGVETAFKLMTYEQADLDLVLTELSELKKKTHLTSLEEKKRLELEQKVVNIQTYLASPATLKLQMMPVRYGTGKQPHFRDLQISIDHPEHFKNREGQIVFPTLMIESMDNSCANGVCARQLRSGDQYSNKIYFKFKTVGTRAALETILYKDSLLQRALDSTGMPSETTDYNDILQSCSGGGLSGGGVNLDAFKNNWEQNFTLKAADSWFFASDALQPAPRIFSSDSLTFETRSILSDCIVQSNVEFLAGFFVCERLIIQARQKPLKMIGTFIPTKDFMIDPSAIKAGIRIQNMHHPDALHELKLRNIIKRADGSSCHTLPVPHWHPDPGLPVLADKVRCSALFFLKGNPTKTPSRWTSVDPDCARIGSADINTTCIRRLRNFNIFEIETQYGM